jgi:hypothetical protein
MAEKCGGRNVRAQVPETNQSAKNEVCEQKALQVRVSNTVGDAVDAI